MAKDFILAEVRANGTRWNVRLSNEGEPETFVAKDGALGFLANLSKPVQALVYRCASDDLEEAWFYENGTKRKLNVLTRSPSEGKRGNW